MRDKSSRTRRSIVKSLTVVSAASVAGCSMLGGGSDESSDDGEDGSDGSQQTADLGERVPSVSVGYFSNARDGSVSEERARMIAQNIEEKLGVPTSTESADIGAATGSMVNDGRMWALPYARIHPKPVRLDPTDQMRFLALSWVTVGGGVSNWVGKGACEYDNLWKEQQDITDIEERKNMVNQAINTATRDVAAIPVTNAMNFSAWNTNLIDTENIGRMAANEQNPEFFITSTPREGNQIVGHASVEALGSRQPTRRPDGTVLWSQLVHSGLQWFNADLERENLLAQSIEVSEDGTEIVVEIVDGAVFHNGDALTAEDVKFTFDFLANNPGAFNDMVPWPHESIEIIDDTTVQFNLEEWSQGLVSINFPMTGIYHKESMLEAGLRENPQQYTFDDVSNIVGSGPFKPVEMTPNSTLQLEPFSDHPLFDPDHILVFRAFSSGQGAQQAFRNGELHTIFGLQSKVFEDLLQDDRFEGNGSQGWTVTGLWPQQTFAPTKFQPFRKAVAQVIDRKAMNQLTTSDRATEQYVGGTVPSTHPWYDEEQVDQIDGMPAPNGNVEAARETLRDAGWGWDDDGRLRYPADADLSPPWPQGEGPDPAAYPCMDSSG